MGSWLEVDGQHFGSVILNLAGHLAHASGEEGAAELGTGSGGKWMGAFFNQVSCLARCTRSVLIGMADARLWRAIARSNRKYLYWEIKSRWQEFALIFAFKLSWPWAVPCTLSR